MAKYNHQNTLGYVCKTGSRTRLRIPVAATRKMNLKPGDKVLISRDAYGAYSVAPSDNGRYTVEKDGAIRFPVTNFSINKNEMIVSTTTNSIKFA
jgi:bifunctional DNA-binding transcriptional regulator/antitoxin component of YhaV-PrlF toxin-antitoxin module